MNDKSPWSAYGRRQNKAEPPPASAMSDPIFGIEREVMLTHEQLKRYLARTLHEFNEIRAGRTGYAPIVAEALKPPPRPESIEETLRRLSGRLPQVGRDRSDPSSTV
jgi:hypothetical protein